MSHFRAIARLLCVPVALLLATLATGCAPPRYTAAFPESPAGAYILNSGDKMRILVFGQESLSNVYSVDGAGHISMPLIGTVKAAGLTTASLERDIAARLRNGFVREP